MLRSSVTKRVPRANEAPVTSDISKRRLLSSGLKSPATVVKYCSSSSASTTPRVSGVSFVALSFLHIAVSPFPDKYTIRLFHRDILWKYRVVVCLQGMDASAGRGSQRLYRNCSGFQLSPV